MLFVALEPFLRWRGRRKKKEKSDDNVIYKFLEANPFVFLASLPLFCPMQWGRSEKGRRRRGSEHLIRWAHY
jgi:hypothetical protein